VVRVARRSGEAADAEFHANGYVVTALQAAWSAIHSTRDDAAPFEAAIRRAVSIGDDTDTVAAIAGSLVGASFGGTVIPRPWRQGLSGWPHVYRDVDLCVWRCKRSKRATWTTSVGPSRLAVRHLTRSSISSDERITEECHGHH